jgi:phage-related protein
MDHVVTWDEFKNVFRAHHIPEGLMERKLNEFLALTQGTRTVLQYNLSKYMGYHADTNAKKSDHFRRGLNTKLKEHLNPIRTDTYKELVNLAIIQEDCILAHHAEKKRKAPAGPSSAQPPRYHLVQNAAAPKALQNAP